MKVKNWMKKSHSRALILGIMILFSTGILLFAAIGFPGEKIKIQYDKPKDFNEGWYVEEQGGAQEPIASLPCTLDVVQQEGACTAQIKNTVPQKLTNGTILLMKTEYQQVQAFCKDRMIYEYGYAQSPPFGTMFGSVLHQIPLSADAAGETITLKLSTPYTDASKIEVHTAVIGNKNAVVLYVLGQNMGRILFCLFSGAGGIIFLAVACIFWKKKVKVNYRAFFWIGLLAVLSSAWVFSDSNLIQFFSGRLAAGYMLSFFSFMLMPVAFLLYMQEVCRHRWKIMDFLFYTYALYYVVALCLYVEDKVELLTTVAVTHIFIIVMIVMSFAIGIYEIRYYGNRVMHTILKGMAILQVCALASILLFYQTESEYTVIFRTGFFLFMLFLWKALIGETIRLLRKGLEASIYQGLAYTDVLTGIANRSAYEKRMKELGTHFKKYKRISLIIFDLDHLKEINDNYGHASGDAYIQAFAEMLKKCCKGRATVYRIGGDEFTLLILDDSHIETYIKFLEEAAEEYNRNAQHKLSFSWGAAQKDTALMDTYDKYEIFKEADARMYEMKEKRTGTKSL